MDVGCAHFMSFADPHQRIHIAARNNRRRQKIFSWNPRRAYRAPIALLMAVSTETRLEAPICGVAIGNFPPAFWRLVSAISMWADVSAFEYCQRLKTHQIPCLRLSRPRRSQSQPDRTRQRSDEKQGKTKTRGRIISRSGLTSPFNSSDGV